MVTKRIFILILLLGCISTSNADIYIDREDLPSSKLKSESNLNRDDIDLKKYKIKRGNVLEIIVKQDPKLNGKYKVRDDSQIDFPLIGKLHAEDKTPHQLGEELTKRLKKDFIRNPQVTILLVEYTLPTINITGALLRPGTYFFNQKITLTDAIGLAGGPSRSANLSNIEVVREQHNQNEKQSKREFYNYDLIKKNEIKDPEFFGNESIIISELIPIDVGGSVLQPGTVFVPNSSTLRQVLDLAGGLTNMADTKSINVYTSKIDAGITHQIYDLDQVISGKVEEPTFETVQRVFVEECTGKINVFGYILCIKNQNTIKK